MPDYDPFLGQAWEEQQTWCMDHNSDMHPMNPMDPYAPQLTQEEPAGQGGASLYDRRAATDSPNPRLRVGRATKIAITRMSSINASVLITPPRPPRQRGRRR